MRTIITVCNNTCYNNNYPLCVNCYHCYYCIIIVDVFIIITVITSTTPGDTATQELEGRVSRIRIFFSLKPHYTPPATGQPASICGLKKGKKDEKASTAPAHIVRGIESSHWKKIRVARYKCRSPVALCGIRPRWYLLSAIQGFGYTIWKCKPVRRSSPHRPMEQSMKPESGGEMVDTGS